MPKHAPDHPASRTWGPAALGAALAIAAAGCGGGDRPAADGPAKTTTGAATTKTRTRPAPPVGSGVQDVRAAVSGGQARISFTLRKAAKELVVRVYRPSGGKVEKVGGVRFPGRPAGRQTITWNLRIDGKLLTPGEYRITVRGRGGAGESRQVPLTIPG